MNIIDIHRAFHSRTPDCTFFSIAHETFSRIGHMLGNKTSLSKFKKIEITPSLFSDHDALKLEINSKKKPTYMWRVNNTILKNGLAREEIKDKVKRYI